MAPAREGLTAPVDLARDLAPVLVRALAPDRAALVPAAPARDPVTAPVPAAALADVPAVVSVEATAAAVSAAAATVEVMAAAALAAAAMAEDTDKKAAKFRGFPRNFVYSQGLT